MTEEPSFLMPARDGLEVHVYRWLPWGRPRAVIQVVHGLAEHAGRYSRLAKALTGAGYAVYASDLRGHGRTATAAEELGFFAPYRGWSKCLDDLEQLEQTAARENPGLPVLLLGHSMGATLVRHLLLRQHDRLAAVVLSGASGQPGPLARSGRLTARLERLRLGRRGRSQLMEALTFGAFNRGFHPARTRFDWLSRDEAEVDRYQADPLCGFVPSTQLWVDLLDAWIGISTASLPQAHGLPAYVISGSRDPVSAGGRQLAPIIEGLREAGFGVISKVYPEARHELFNEINREEVTGELLEWLNSVLARGR